MELGTAARNANELRMDSGGLPFRGTIAELSNLEVRHLYGSVKAAKREHNHMKKINQENPEILEKVELANRLEAIFLPSNRAKRDKLYRLKSGSNAIGPDPRFAHYTSAESALKILENKQLWMRNSTCMADYREVQHGFERLNKFFKDKGKRKRFSRCFKNVVPGIADEAIDLFNRWWEDIQYNTFISSISEHDDSEDRHGRLSMWRAFGGTGARVAIVFTIPKYTGVTEVLGIQFGPVSYRNEDDIDPEMDIIIKNVRRNQNFLKDQGRDIVLGSIFKMFFAAVASVKHDGFHEEREWRILYSPARNPSPLIEQSTQVINGIPQIIYKIPFDGVKYPLLEDLDFSKIFDRIIIGPTQFPMAIYKAFVASLENAGISDASSRVFVSNIPIRN